MYACAHLTNVAFRGGQGVCYPGAVPRDFRPMVVVHGGAGLYADDREAEARAGCQQAAEAGRAVLAAGGSALDAAQAAVRVLEDNRFFNAAVGAALTRAGTVEVDAALMDGRDL